MFSLVLKAFFLNPVLPILLVAAAVLGIILAYAGGRKMMSTVFVVEAVALIVYTCIFLFGIAPALGTGAAIVAMMACMLLWRASLIQQHGATIVVAAVFAVLLLLAA